MKIKVKDMAYEDVLRLPKKAHKRPLKPSPFFRLVMRAASVPDLLATRFSFTKIGMEKLGRNEPCLVLMNHSSFIDLEIAATVLFPRPFSIVCTTDGFVGKGWLMRLIGCIPTQKFVTDLSLIRDMQYAVRERGNTVVLFPEAGYTFDGTTAALPDSVGFCVKKLGVPVVMVQTYGAFLRDPLYNNLQKRKVKVSAEVRYLLSPEEVATMRPDEINAKVRDAFAFDNFRWQQENEIRITEPFRADYLNRVLYKCPHCLAEGKMIGRGITLHCPDCKKTYTLTETGRMEAVDGQTEFSHIPDWYAWQRQCVRKDLEEGRYSLSVPVDICMLVDTKCLYRVGEGTLTHTAEGFTLTGCDGKLHYSQKPAASYSLNTDFYWYELGDVISIGTTDALYYCFPKEGVDLAAKTRLAAEELYKLSAPRRSRSREITPTSGSTESSTEKMT
ncbi:MAG: 1-acyl-sn-glycerol-3-phosphate acyltransferase [Ruminococcaceae bacterium]|nr:1-acyl-sn-glycerol-3-phosphate acyltransferase [Oscillospiraceae bacterium]